MVIRKFKVKGTTTQNRAQAMDDYIVVMNPQHRSDLGLGTYAVVSHVIQYGNQRKQLSTYCRVVEDKRLSQSNDPSDVVVGLDQSVRNAIGIRRGYEGESRVFVSKINTGLHVWFRDLVSRRLGRRYLLFRVEKAHVPDIEKDLSRIPVDSFGLLGTEVGSGIVAVNALSRERLDLLKIYHGWSGRRIHSVADRFMDQVVEARKVADEFDQGELDQATAEIVEAGKKMDVTGDCQSIADVVRLEDEELLQDLINRICPILERNLPLVYELRNIEVKCYELTKDIEDVRGPRKLDHFGCEFCRVSAV